MTPSMVLIRSGKNRYPDLVSDSREKRLGCKCDASCRLLVDALYQVEEVLFYF